jgi:hypothetical protein
VTFFAPRSLLASCPSCPAGRAASVNGRPAKVFGLTGSDGRPGIRLAAGERFRVDLANEAGTRTIVHWHGELPPWSQDGFQWPQTPPIAKGAVQAYDYAPISVLAPRRVAIDEIASAIRCNRPCDCCHVIEDIKLKLHNLCSRFVLGDLMPKSFVLSAKFGRAPRVDFQGAAANSACCADAISAQIVSAVWTSLDQSEMGAVSVDAQSKARIRSATSL